MAASAVSYNSSEAVEGEWSIFIADGSGVIVLHLNPAMIGKGLDELLGTDALEIDEEGIWVVSLDGWVVGAGWRDDES